MSEFALTPGEGELYAGFGLVALTALAIEAAPDFSESIAVIPCIIASMAVAAHGLARVGRSYRNSRA